MQYIYLDIENFATASPAKTSLTSKFQAVEIAMPSREDVYYFGAGPAPLPTPVLEEASKVILNYNDSPLV